MSNGLDTEQDGRSIHPDPGPNCLQKLTCTERVKRTIYQNQQLGNRQSDISTLLGSLSNPFFANIWTHIRSDVMSGLIWIQSF